MTFEAAGPHEKARFFELIPVPVEYNSGLEERTESMDGRFNPFTIRRTPFMIYEVLQPIKNILTASSTVMAAAFRCKIEVTNNSCHMWELRISHQKVTRILRFEVEVFDVEVPPADNKQHKYVNWIFLDEIASSHHLKTWSLEWEAMVEKYFCLAHYARQNMVCLWPKFYFDMDEKGRPSINENKLDTLIKLADRAGIYWLQGGTIAERKDGEWEASDAVISLNKDPFPGEGEKTLHIIAASLYDYLHRKGIAKRWIQSFFDEPLDVSGKIYRLGTDIIRRAMPGVLIVEATKARDAIVGTLDIWCPTVNKYELYQDFFDMRRRAGDHIWVYTCLEPTGNYCNRLLDMERLRKVWLGWAPAKYLVEGFLHWGGNWTAFRSPFTQSTVPQGDDFGFEFDFSNKQQLPAGDHVISYPGYLQPLSCTRLEAQRIGLEDLCILQKLKEKEPEMVKEIVDTVFRGYADYEKDVPRYRTAKRKLLSAAYAAGNNQPAERKKE